MVGLPALDDAGRVPRQAVPEQVVQRMWSTLHRTRRRIMRVGSERPLVLTAAAAEGTLGLDPDAEAPNEVVIAIGRPEFDRLGAALQTVLGGRAVRLDTPDLLEAALTEAIAGLGATAQTRVARRPAGLYTPEGWELGLTTTDPIVETAIRRAIREGVFAA
ncbi:MAG: hypothetical protein K0S97_1972 [Chloroflexota bacterium]|jgi:hypothetical protein|nr:hypothetical protein [Chloroflexota bacterium]